MAKYPEREVACSGGCGKIVITTARKNTRYCPECKKKRESSEHYKAVNRAAYARRAAARRATLPDTARSLGGTLLIVYDPTDADIYTRTVTVNGEVYSCSGSAGGMIISSKAPVHVMVNFRDCRAINMFTGDKYFINRYGQKVKDE